MRTAILFFALEARTEARRKQLLAGRDPSQQIRLHTFLRKRTLGVLEQSGLTVLDWSDELQRGEGFAARFCNAIEDAFALGFDKLIIAGSDLPFIGSGLVRSAASALKDGRSALAGTDQGGAGLIAIRKQDYSRVSWMQIRWQTCNVHYDLQAVLPDAHLLDELSELNEPRHLQQLIHRPASNKVLRILKDLIHAFLKPCFGSVLPSFSTDVVSGLFRRGPPAFLALQK